MTSVKSFVLFKILSSIKICSEKNFTFHKFYILKIFQSPENGWSLIFFKELK